MVCVPQEKIEALNKIIDNLYTCVLQLLHAVKNMVMIERIEKEKDDGKHKPG